MTTKTVEYVWASNKWMAGDANAVGHRVQEIAVSSPEGVCSPVAYRNDALDPRSPLYSTIEHDAEIGLFNWQIHQARRIMNSLRIVIDGKLDTAPAFVSLRIITDDGVTSGYMSSRSIPTKDLQNQALETARSLLNGIRRRYSHLEALQPGWDALDSV